VNNDVKCTCSASSARGGDYAIMLVKFNLFSELQRTVRNRYLTKYAVGKTV
jgi:hypothetical protein